MKALGPNILRRHSEWPLIEAVGVYFGKRLKTFFFCFLLIQNKEENPKGFNLVSGLEFCIRNTHS